MNANKIKNIDILCNVVDNYGDIGFVYRLSRSISQIDNSINIRLVVNNLHSFAKLFPSINENLSYQKINNWTILDWNNSNVCKKEFLENHTSVILQCFQCERPEWLEDILFDKSRTEVVHILNIEYLTAEKWADDFHLLKSGTRSAFIKKINFMPGFSNKTAGLVLDEPFINYVHDNSLAINALEKFLPSDDISILKNKDIFSVVVFSYPRDFNFLVKALGCFQNEKKKVHVFCANGISYEPFMKSWDKEGRPFEISTLPFLPQTVWDAFLCASDFNFVRGEDSLSRAVLCGKPFVWHAYIQKEEYQIVKVEALLDAMETFFSHENFILLKKFCLLYNRNEENDYGSECASIIKKTFSSEDFSDCDGKVKCLLLKELFSRYDEIKNGFELFSNSLEKNGNLTKNLFMYFDSL